MRTVTHELLHNVVGDINGTHVPGDPGHSPQGWLAHVERADQLEANSQLHPDVARQLSRTGFKSSDYYEYKVC